MSRAKSFFVVEERKVEGRRSKRRTHLIVDGGILVVASGLAVVSAFSPNLLDVQSSDLLYIGMGLLFAIGAYSFLRDLQTLRSINFVAVNPEGLSPPFKPKQRRSMENWFVPYKDLASMEPVGAKLDFVPAYDVTLRDGLTFQLNALDLLVYVPEKEVRRFAKILAVIKEEVDKPENRAVADRGGDLIIPRERFSAALT